MSQTVEEQLAEIKEEIADQGKVLRRVDRRMRFATYGSILKWVAYVGLALGAFVWLQPYLEAIVTLGQKMGSGAEAVTGFKESWRGAFSDFVESFQQFGGSVPESE